METVNTADFYGDDVYLKNLFWKVVRSDKVATELTAEEIHALIARVGYLSEDEQKRFSSVLVRENLTPFEIEHYSSLKILDRYFPV